MIESIKDWLSNSSFFSHLENSQNGLQKFDFINFTQIAANDPIEDKIAFTKLKNIQGFTVSVFDGHSGDILSVFAAKNINAYLEERIKYNKGLLFKKKQEIIKKSLEEAYQDIETNFYNLNKQKILRQKLTVGTCGLTALILKDQIYVANCGDCMGLLLSDYKYSRTNKISNANQQEQQNKLRQSFPKEKNLIHCFGQNLCYLKGVLQPTRTLGDYHLKYKSFNILQINPWNGPYVQHKPIITHFQYNNKYDQLVLGSDGLWDQFTDQQQTQIERTVHINKLTNDLICLLKKQFVQKTVSSNETWRRQKKYS